METVLGIIGGSGLYNLNLEESSWVAVDSPWGKPSDSVLRGRLHGLPVVFLPRHGRGHLFTPSSINYRANIDVLKRAGVTDILSMSAVGSLREELKPGSFLIVDQYIDLTYARKKTFFDTGLVGHVAFSRPISPYLQHYVVEALNATDIMFHNGGCYITIEGPQFSTLAESQLYRTWQASVIGMTNMPEAKLAREAEMTYCSVAMITDYDAWHLEYGQVDVTQVVAVMKQHAHQAVDFVTALAKILPRRVQECPAGSRHALDGAIMTVRSAWDPDSLAKLDAVAGRLLKAK